MSYCNRFTLINDYGSPKLSTFKTFPCVSGTDVIHAAIEKLENSNQTNWESVTMEIHVSTINLIKTAVSSPSQFFSSIFLYYIFLFSFIPLIFLFSFMIHLFNFTKLIHERFTRSRFLSQDRTLLAEHRVRFVSFMALGKQEHHLGYIVHGGPRIFYCHVYQVCWFVCLFLCLQSVCLLVRLSVCLPLYLSECLIICIV